MNYKKLEMFSLDITYQCNMNCLHCFNHSGEKKLYGKKELLDEEIMDILKEVYDFIPKTICICGGETLLRKELVYSIAKQTKDYLGDATEVSLVTNGQNMTKEIAEELKKSGINYVQISLDGGSAKTYEWFRNKKNSYQKALNAIKFLKEAQINVMVSACPNKLNIKEYNDIIRICEELGVKNLRVQPLMLLGRASENLFNYVPTQLEYYKLQQLFSKYEGTIGIEWGDPIEHLARAIVGEDVPTYSMSVDAYGDVSLSPYIPIRFGNLKHTTLTKLWERCLSSKLS